MKTMKVVGTGGLIMMMQKQIDKLEERVSKLEGSKANLNPKKARKAAEPPKNAQTKTKDADHHLSKHNKEKAKVMREFAKSFLAESKSSWKGHKKMIMACQVDASNYRAIGSLILKGKLKRAAEFINGLDTCVRDEIPDEVYDYVMLYSD